ncbi:MAG: Asp-tRNA(Asn)/Glu-tRNA(Gln) amidotransferase subunit GatA [bacterium]|nr:MAG: Asp-tRNA(Asn)/Glu-tRNA(Gln) amidotransferase subunit GatA [bacterium]
MDLYRLTIHDLHEELREGRVTSNQITESVFDRIAEVDGRVRAYLTLTKEAALEAAARSDERYRRGDFLGPLDGIPIALKDIFLTEGIRTTCASKVLENFIPPYDGTPVVRLKEAGAVITGKLNMDEFAMGSSNENSGFFPTHNPWNTQYVPGGSSGGSAASVAAGEAIGALGTDTGGSIRQPASHCGVVGMKPTYGRVSRYGIIAFASSLDQVGPLARTVTDCSILLRTIAGHDPADSTSAEVPVPDYPSLLDGKVEGMKVGLPEEYFSEGLDPEVERLVREAAHALERRGMKMVPVSLPSSRYAVATYYIIAPAEASSNLARYDGVRYGVRVPDAESLMEMYKRSRSRGFGAEVQRRIMLGTFALSAGYYDAYYGKAQKIRTLIRREMDEAFSKVDVLLAPTAPTAAFPIGEKMDDPLQMYMSDVYTIPVNIAGVAAISVPCGITPDGLPVGVQLISPPFGEEVLLNVAFAYEQERGTFPNCPL